MSQKPIVRPFLAAFTVASMFWLPACSSEPSDPLAAAQLAYQRAEPYSAMELAEAAIAANPEGVEPRLVAADVAMMLGNPDRAVSELERVIESETAPEIAMAKLIEAYVAANFLGKAHAMKDEVPLDHPQAFVSLILLEMADGEYAEAYDLLDKGASQFPDDHRLAVLDAERMLAFARVRDAEQRLAPALSARPAIAEAHMLAGRMALSSGDLDKANVHFEDAVKVRPEHQPTILALAAIAHDRGDQQTAENWINKANRLGNGHPVAVLFAAQTAYDAGDVEQAFALIERVPPSFRDQPQYARLRGLVEAVRGQYGLAIDPLQDFVATTGGDIVARRVLAQCLIEQDRMMEAWEAVSPLIDHPESDRATLTLARALAVATGLGDQAKIERQIERRAMAPDLSQAMVAAGQAIRAGQWAAADRIYQPLVDGAGAHEPVLLNNAAAVKSKLGQHRQAVALARRALATYPDSPEILDTLGWALWQQGEDLAEALEVLTKARAGAPKNPEIAEHWAIAHAGR